MTLGLTSKEAQEKLSQSGPNAIETKKHPVFEFFAKFWGPIPWMLELTIIFQLCLGKKSEVSITICLLLFNAVVGFTQESRAQSALSLLRSKLKIKARVFRDQIWTLVDAHNIVPGDMIRIRVGDFVPADIKLVEGNILVDQSSLTGESLPIELSANNNAFSGSIVKRGEATGIVTATGIHSFFGKTTELVQSAKSQSHFEKMVLQIVKYLVAIDVFLVSAILIYSSLAGLKLSDILPFALILLVASIPIALPATFTLMSALTSLMLAKKDILVTKLAAIEEAGVMNLLFCDKTGTLTQNRLSLTDLQPISPITKLELLKFAAFASNDANQDPIDISILSLAKKSGIDDFSNRLTFTPFDPIKKISEATTNDQNKIIRIVKGAPSLVASLTHAEGQVANTASQNNRILSIAIGEGDQLKLAGFLVFSDPIREDSKNAIDGLKDLGITIKMLTGDNSTTAVAIAQEVGIGSRVCPKSMILSNEITNYDVFAEVYPQDKYLIMQTFQQEGYIVGMTGDGVNDAPALKQADIGVAVSNATDVAKAAAGIVLTSPGLQSLIEVIKSGRAVYRRTLTYTLNKVVKTTHIALFLSLGLLFENVFMITPHLVMLLIFANDFATMSLATDNVRISKNPRRLNIQFLIITSFLLALCWLCFSFGVYYVAKNYFQFSLPAIQTLVFLMFVFTGLATVYLVRTVDYLWKMPPGKWLLFTTCGDILVVSLLAYLGVWMESVTLGSILFLMIAVIVFMFFLDFIKVFVLQNFYKFLPKNNQPDRKL